MVNKKRKATFLKGALFVAKFIATLIVAYFVWVLGVFYIISSLSVGIIVGLILMIVLGVAATLLAFWLFFRLLTRNKY